MSEWKSDIATPLAFTEAVSRLYERGLARGFTTGWALVDELYSVVPGLWTLITGYPGSGKSEWLDALTLNLAKDHGWRFCYYSPENQPRELHVAKLLEKITGKPFFPGPTDRMTPEEIVDGNLWMSDHFAFIQQSEGPKSITEILEVCYGWIKESRVDHPAGIIIDPWNEIEHEVPHGLSETLYISQTLTKLRQFARNTNCHIWIVAHPKLVAKENGVRPIPTPSDVSGGAHWWNKADFAITVHRDQSADSQDVQIHLQKARFKHAGKQGMALLKWNRVNGRYHEPFTSEPKIMPMSQYRQQPH